MTMTTLNPCLTCRVCAYTLDILLACGICVVDSQPKAPMHKWQVAVGLVPNNAFHGKTPPGETIDIISRQIL